MRNRDRIAIMFAVGVFAATASFPALGQSELATPYSLPNRFPSPPAQRFPEPRRDTTPSPPSPWSSPSPWSAAPAPRAGSFSGGLTQRQAMDLLAAAGFRDIDAPQPNFDGSWTSYVYSHTQRRKVRATVDLQGNISTRDDYR